MIRTDLDLTIHLIRHGQTDRNLDGDKIGQDPEEPIAMSLHIFAPKRPVK